MVKPGPGSLQVQAGPRLCSPSAASRPRSFHADFSCASLHRAAVPAALLRTVDVKSVSPQSCLASVCCTLSPGASLEL